MTTYDITQSSRVDGYGVLQTLESLPAIPLGNNINVVGSTRGLDGNSQKVWSLVEYELLRVTDEGELVFDYDVYRPNQIIFPNVGDDLAEGNLQVLDFNGMCVRHRLNPSRRRLRCRAQNSVLR